MSFCFWDLKVLIVSFLQSDLSRAFLHLGIRLENEVENATWEWDFYERCGFSRIINIIMFHDLDQKNLHINELIYLQNPKNPIFAVVLSILPKLTFSPQNPLYQFLPLRHPNFMGSFKKIIWATLEKKGLPTDLPT